MFFPRISSAQIVGILAAGTLLALAAGAVTVRARRRCPTHLVALPHAVDRAGWRMPPLALLDRAVLSGSRRLGLSVLRGYLVIASALVVVRVVQLALGH